MGNSKEEARERVKILVDKFNEYKEQDLLKGYNEDNTCKDFILPLFRALGWGVETSKEVEGQKTVSSGRVDYAFYLDGIPKFYLEAKSIPEDLNDEKYVKQAINYAYNKGVTWAVLSNFDRIKIFNAEWHTEPSKACVLNLSIDDYLTDFDLLWELSKEGIRQELLYDRARKFGQIATKEPVGERLYQDLTIWRQEFFKYISGYYKKDFTFAQVDEIIQRILNRLVFIRTCEDREIEQPFLLPLVREWKASRKFRLEKKLQELFKDFNGWYNSKLFTHHSCDEIDTEDTPYAEVIEGLYGSKDEIVRYDFSALSVDVLGRVYEQYLGYVAKAVEPKKRKQLVIDGFDEKTIILEKEKKRRKEQGIYYTPSFIVDYIVNNALRPVLDKCRDVSDLKKIKVLDPACGSGSFLIKALEVINNKYREFDYKGDELTKIQILEENLYGVDLDEQAIEITRLNLLINSLDRRKELPFLKHIKNGNSLISGSEEELKKYFGDNYCGKKPFNWQKEFPEVFKQGGFDVIIGNPPYANLANISDPSERDYLKSRFVTAKNKSDLYSFFTERAVNLLKKEGSLGFIFSNSWLGTDSFSKFRQFLIENTVVSQMVELPPGVFADATVTTVLIFLRSHESTDNHIIRLVTYKNGKFNNLPRGLSYKRIKSSPGFSFSFDPEISFKIPTIKLGDVAKFSLGIKTSDDKTFISDAKKDDNSYRLLRGKDVRKYYYLYVGKWIWYMPNLMMKKTGAGPRRLENFLVKKILIKDVAQEIIAAYDYQGYLSTDTLNVIYQVKDYDLKFILALLNSKIVNRWFKTNFPAGLHIKINQLKEIPLPQLDLSNLSTKRQHDSLVRLVDDILDLNKKLDTTLRNTDEWSSLNTEIEKKNKEINEKVYQLYDLTPEEIEIVER